MVACFAFPGLYFDDYAGIDQRGERVSQERQISVRARKCKLIRIPVLGREVPQHSKKRRSASDSSA